MTHKEKWEREIGMTHSGSVGMVSNPLHRCLMLTFPGGGSEYRTPSDRRVLGRAIFRRIKPYVLLCDTTYISIMELLGNADFFGMYADEEVMPILTQLYDEQRLAAIAYEDDIEKDDVLIRTIAQRMTKDDTRSHIAAHEVIEHAEFLAEVGLRLKRINNSEMRLRTNGRIVSRLELLLRTPDVELRRRGMLGGSISHYKCACREACTAIVESDGRISLSKLRDRVAEVTKTNTHARQNTLDYLKIQMIRAMAAGAQLCTHLDKSILYFEGDCTDGTDYRERDYSKVISPLSVELRSAINCIPDRDLLSVRRQLPFVQLRDHLAARRILNEQELARVVSSIIKDYVHEKKYSEQLLAMVESAEGIPLDVRRIVGIVCNIARCAIGGDYAGICVQFQRLAPEFISELTELVTVRNNVKEIREFRERRRKLRDAIRLAALNPYALVNSICHDTFIADT